MNKQTFSIEFSFDVDAGTIELLDDDKWCVNQLITPEVFIERYRNHKLDLMDKTHIDKIAQQVLKIAENAIKNMEKAVKNAFKEIAGCARGELLPESELDRLANIVKDSLCEKLKISLPRHFVSNGGAKITNISLTTVYYGDKVFVDLRSPRVYMNVHICVSIEVTLDDKKSIDREKLFKLIENRYADFAWYGELSRYTIRTQFGELEIEYR
jgi:hypothetical protein